MEIAGQVLVRARIYIIIDADSKKQKNNYYFVKFLQKDLVV